MSKILQESSDKIFRHRTSRKESPKRHRFRFDRQRVSKGEFQRKNRFYPLIFVDHRLKENAKSFEFICHGLRRKIGRIFFSLLLRRLC